MRTNLHRIEIRAEVLSIFALELVQLALVRTVELSGQFGLHLAACYQALELGTGLSVISNHLRCERLFGRIALRLRELVGFDFEPIRNSSFLDEISSAPG